MGFERANWRDGGRRNALVALLVIGVIALSACTSIGPQRLESDNTAYNDALGEAWKRQMLLNMVKLRYGDAPVFLNVASLINQYSLEGQISINSPGWDRPNNVGPPIAGAAGRWADRPTITYTPVTGEHFTRSLLTPIQPMSLLSMVQSGWPVEFVFGVAVRSINGIANGTRAHLLQQEPDPRFGELLHSLTEIQRSSAIDIRIDRRPDGEVAVLVIKKGDLGPVAGARRRVREILDVGAEVTEFRLEYGAIADRPDAVAMLTRSLLEIIGEFSFGVDVPQQHLEQGRCRPAPRFEGEWKPPTMQIYSGSDQPNDAFVAVRYRDLWFWIDDTDFPSKRRFSFLLLLTSLAETGASPAAPLITVGTGG
jgi:hypothetical protein